MERYLSPNEIKKWPVGKRYKKSIFGGNKKFIKKTIKGNGEKITLEFFLKNGLWNIEKLERKKVKSANKEVLGKIIKKLNDQEKRKLMKFPISKRNYLKIYTDYQDADQLGYYSRKSPEYIRVKDFLKNIKGGSLVYDAGCNSGGIGKILIRKKRCKVSGSELCPRLARLAGKSGLKIFCGWAEKTPFASNAFDVAILSFILEHALDPQKIICESVRLLKNDGIVLGHVPTEFGDWGKNNIGIHPEHLRAFSKKELWKLLEKCGLKNIIIKKEKLVGRRIADYYFFKAKK